MALIKKIFICAVLVSPLFARAAKPAQEWSMVNSPGAKASLESISKNAFKVTLIRTEKEISTTTLVRNIKQQMPSQYRLSFQVRGKNDHQIFVTPLLTYLHNGKNIMKFGPRITVRGTQWQNCRFSLDSAFQLGDALFDVRQLKFACNINALPAGSEAGVEVKDIRLHAASEAEGNIIVSLPPDPPAKAGRKKIYFHFDNDDFASVARNRRRPAIADTNPDSGFRSRLLKHIPDHAEVTRDPAEANLIVYTSFTPDPKAAAKIVDAVKNGTPLLACGEIADQEIMELLPVTFRKTDTRVFPDRDGIRFADSSHPLAKGNPLSKAKFGIYRKLNIKKGKAVLVFNNGSPAIAEGIAGKGKVLYSTFPPGSDLIPGTDGIDAFLLRMTGYLTGTNFPEHKQGVSYPDSDGWRVGAGKENFGRFGFLIGDGLLTEILRNDLSVANDCAEYAFSSRRALKLPLSEWRFREEPNLQWRNQTWNIKWHKIGTVELETDCNIPAEWKDKEIQFVTAEGIDDLAEVYFNGKLLGKVTKDVPEYWKAPHCYTIPQETIRVGSPNRIRVVSVNLRGDGGFNSCPELVVPETRKSSKLTIDRINWLGKGGVLTEDNGAQRRFDTSLAFPGIRWVLNEKQVELSLRNIAAFAAFSTPQGNVTLDLQKTNSIPTEQWNAPWLLLFGNEYPLLLVFEHRPEFIRIQRAGTDISGLQITAQKDKIGTIVPVWLFGKQAKKSSLLTKEIEERIRFWYPKALCFPSECEEYFRIGKRVEIRNRYKYLEFKDDWNTPSVPYAPVPQLAFLMRNTLFQGDGVKEWPLSTLFGPYAARSGSDTVTWSLPLPPRTQGIYPARELPDTFKQHANKLFAEGNRWSAGGKTPFAYWTPKFPMGADFPECKNISMHAWIMGLNQAWMTPWILSENNRKALEERTRIRFCFPIEQLAHKVATRYREEPFSRIAYPIYFNSFYRNEIQYEGRPASRLNYGDQNETAMMLFSIARKLADHQGQAEFVRSNWSFFKEVSRLPLVSDDWGHLSCHCRESGEAATIDMLNCEYPAMTSLARLAEIAGDDEMRDQALYRASRRMVPTLARFVIRDYAVANSLKNPETLGISTGFDEEGAVFHRKNSPYRAVELFDMSQGIEPDLVELYRLYAKAQIRSQYLEPLQKKLLGGAPELSYELAAAISLLGTLPKEEQLKLFNKLIENQKLTRLLSSDWPGISIGSYLAVFNTQQP